MAGIVNFFASFGSPYIKERETDVVMGGLNIEAFTKDVTVLWKNSRVMRHMFKEIHAYRIVFDKFYVPDVYYVLGQILEYKKRKSSKYRLKELRSLLVEKTWFKSTQEPHADILNLARLSNLHHTLFAHQIETLKIYNDKVPQMNLMGFLLSTPPGSGKTIMSIALSATLEADVAFYIVPKSTALTVWYDGLVEELGPTAKIWTSVHDVPITDAYDHYVFHYEALPLAMFFARKLTDRKKPFIAIDESHNFNEIGSTRTLRLIELSKLLKCQNTVFATGTPVKALGVEMIPLLRTIDPLFTPQVELGFKAIYGANAKRANDILRNRLGLMSHKIREDSYMTIPPPKEIELAIRVPNAKRFLLTTIKSEMQDFMKLRYQYYKANMQQYLRTYEQGIAYYEKQLRTSEERAELATYKQYVKIILAGYDPIAHKEYARFIKEVETKKIIPSLPPSMRNAFRDCLSVVKYTKARVLGEALGLLERKRGECASELARHGNLENLVTDADKKTIIFSSHIPALTAANDYFTALGFKTLQVHGDFTKDVTGIVNQFKKDPECNPLIATLQSLAASQTLTVANVVIFLNAPFREYIRDQAFHRVFRIGQDAQTYIYLCQLDTGLEPNISTRSADILEWSRTQAQEIFGSLTKDELAGIVQRLRLNPPTGLGALLDMIKGVKFS